MFEPNSRYVELPIKTHARSDGTTIRYVARRFLPPPGGVPLARMVVASGDRLDNITARSLGDPTLYWRVCDATDVLDPPDLVARPGVELIVPSPLPGGA